MELLEEAEKRLINHEFRRQTSSKMITEAYEEEDLLKRAKELSETFPGLVYETHGSLYFDKYTYKGTCQENNRYAKEGKGVYEKWLGDKYVGDWKENERNGYGTMYYENETIYTGQWKDNMKQGFGIYKARSGTQFIGEWFRNELHGHCIVKLDDGFISYEGSFK